MAAEIVDDDDVTGLERGHQNLFDVSQEAFTVDRAIDHARSFDPVMAQGGEECQRPPEECQRPPAAMWRFGDQSFSSRCATVGARHIGLGPGLAARQSRWESVLPHPRLFPKAVLLPHSKCCLWP